jgi:hypothetical protein
MGSFEGTGHGKSMSCQSTAVRTEVRFRRDSKYYTPPDSYHYSDFTNFWYTFEYRCQNGTRPALDMGLTKGRLEVEQVE